MNRVIFTAFFAISAISAAFGQTRGQQSSASQCTLKLSDSPSIRGIHLGMSADQLLPLFPGSRENPDIKSKLEWAKRAPNYGLVTLAFHSHAYLPSPLFTNVNQFEIQLFDERVTNVWVYYVGPPWRSVDEMITKVSETLDLPDAKDWVPLSPGDQSTKILKCAGFEVTVTAYIGSCCNSIRLRIPTVEQQIGERRAADEEKARHEFKP